MTLEEFEKGRKLKEKIERLYDYKRTITPFISERVELKISWEKGLCTYIPDEETHRKITIFSDDPIVAVLCKTLDYAIASLEMEFEELGKPKDAEKPMPQKQNVPNKKVWWKRIFCKS